MRSDSPVDFALTDAIAREYFDRGAQPAICYGVVCGGVLVHSAGFGARFPGGPPPDADTVFRIASMSKSFTASAIMLLRDEGRLALDDAAEKYVPELAGWPPVTPDADRVTIRHLLTMTAGFPTDDPWGDRQQGLPPAGFTALLAGGVGFTWAPGTRFEYSNLGYAILGRVVAQAAGVPYDEFTRTRLLAPLGMTRTGFEASEFPAASLARGYRRGPAGWEEVPFDPYGAFAPMGGVFSCVRDLARWVAGFASAFPPGEADAGGPHPLRRASRREMQLPQAVTAGRARILRLRAVRRRGPGTRPGGRPQRRLPRGRRQHAVAPGDRARRDRAGEQQLRPDVRAGRADPPGTGAASGPRPRGAVAGAARSPPRGGARPPGRGAVAGDHRGGGRGEPAAPGLGRRGRGRPVLRQRRAGQPLPGAPPRHRRDQGADRRLQRGRRPPRGVGHPGAPPVVADGPPRNGPGAAPAQPAAAAAGAVADARRAAGRGLGAGQGPGIAGRLDEQRRQGVAVVRRRGPRCRPRPARPPSPDGRRLGGHLRRRRLPRRRRQRVGEHGADRRARHGGAVRAGQSRHRRTPPGGRGPLAAAPCPRRGPAHRAAAIAVPGAALPGAALSIAALPGAALCLTPGRPDRPGIDSDTDQFRIDSAGARARAQASSR